jgi:hypothetical protein
MDEEARKLQRWLVYSRTEFYILYKTKYIPNESEHEEADPLQE